MRRLGEHRTISGNPSAQGRDDAGPRVHLLRARGTRAWCERLLLDHLGWLRHSGQLAILDDRQIKPGEKWDDRIRAELAGGTLVTAIDGVAAGGDAPWQHRFWPLQLRAARPGRVEELTKATAAREASGPLTGWRCALAPAAAHQRVPRRASAAAVLAWTTAAMALDVAGSAVTQRMPVARAITSPCAAASSTRLPCQPGQPGRRSFTPTPAPEAGTAREHPRAPAVTVAVTKRQRKGGRSRPSSWKTPNRSLLPAARALIAPLTGARPVPSGLIAGASGRALRRKPPWAALVLAGLRSYDASFAPRLPRPKPPSAPWTRMSLRLPGLLNQWVVVTGRPPISRPAALLASLGNHRATTKVKSRAGRISVQCRETSRARDRQAPPPAAAAPPRAGCARRRRPWRSSTAASAAAGWSTPSQPARDPEVAVAQRQQPQRALDLQVARRRWCLHNRSLAAPG